MIGAVSALLSVFVAFGGYLALCRVGNGFGA